ncbi:MAG TPA: ATP-binding cassette domain-containing protein, partial [Bacteroidota bacterium]|nr:ATP-binding cassette domain-containing protein [Bacteroidota bacterium]
QGRILFGEMHIGDVRLQSLRSHSAVVPQEIELFHGSVIDNVAYGDREPDLQKILRVCALSGADRFIVHLPHTWNTLLGEHGASLSGGERQRLALARALYRDPKLLILDEATSSLDSESESIILGALGRLREGGVTILAIAHRLSTIMHADKIIVFDKGKVSEEGTHRTLMDREQKYYSLWERQMPIAPRLAV